MFKVSIFLFFLLVSVFSVNAVPQKSEEEIQIHIKNIQIKLSQLKVQLNKAYGKEHQLLVKLEKQDKAINTVANEVKNSTQQIQSLSTEIDNLQAQIKLNERSIEKQKRQIIELLKLQVYLNHDKTLKLLLNNPQNELHGQTKHSIKYLQNKLYNLINSVTIRIKQLESDTKDQLELKEQEEMKKQNLLNQQNTLLEKRKERLHILKQLKQQILSQESESKNLSKDEKRLKSLLDEIKQLLSDLPKDLGTNKPFYKLKGRLIKPVKGKYIRSFHSRRSENTRWNGVVLKATIGSNVKAIAYGRIAFADWLRGFGMLVIIDHQDGYMSLYGFNESINVEAGDWVDQGQIIATIGNSGTLEMPALYFEIRKDAKPLNPKKWLK